MSPENYIMSHRMRQVVYFASKTIKNSRRPTFSELLREFNIPDLILCGYNQLKAYSCSAAAYVYK